MPPDRISGLPPSGGMPKWPEASIPRRGLPKPRRLRDTAVNTQLGPFLAVLFVGVVLVFRPERAELAVATVPLLLAALRRSCLSYRRYSAT